MEIIMLGDYLLVSIALIWTIAACVTDIKKREVENWLSFSLIAIALAIRVLAFLLTGKATYFLYGLVGLIIFFGISNVLYYTKMFGGGDAKLLTGLGAAFGTTPVFAPQSLLGLPFLAIFLFNILLVGSLYGIFYSIFLAIKNKKRFMKEFKSIAKQTTKGRIIFLIFMFIFLLASIYLNNFVLLPLAIILLIFPYLYIFVKSVENSCMIKLLSVKYITEGDWLAEDIKIRKKIIKITAEGLTKNDIKLIRKANKKVLIKQGIPFVPVFLLAIIISLFIGNVFVILAEMML